MNCNKKNADGRFWLLLIMAVLVMTVVMSLCGCKSVREAHEYRELFRRENEQVTMMRDSIGRLHQRIDRLTYKLEQSDSVRTVSKDSTDTKEKVEVYVRDSVSTRQNGDTVFVDRWHWDNRNYQLLQTKFRLDSISQNCKIAELHDYVIVLLDSITHLRNNEQKLMQSAEKSIENERVIEKSTPWWVTLLAWIGGVCIVVAVIFVTAMVHARREGNGNDR